MAKSARILGLFPSSVATEPTSLLATVVAALAGPLEEADTLLFRIQRAHRIRVATQVEDVLHLADALNLHEQHFADLLANDDIGYELRLAAMKRRVERVARLHLSGLGTPWAVVEAAAILLDAELERTETAPSGLRRIDAAGYSHTAVANFGPQRAGQRSRIYLHENPLRPRQVPVADRYPLERWQITAENTEPSPARIVIQGNGERTVLPSVFCPVTGQGIAFYGVVPAGSRLTIDAEDGARMDGRPVDDWISFDVGARTEFARNDIDGCIVEDDGPRVPFDGDMTRLFTPPYRRVKPVPQVPPGVTEWHFNVAQGVYDNSAADFAVYAIPDLPRAVYDDDPGWDESAFDFDSSGTVSMSWYERMPCAFKLLVPPETPGYAESASGAQPESAGPQPVDLGAIAAFVARCKAAGVRAFVDAAATAWILGESKVRSSGATEGGEVSSVPAVLRLQGADLVIPIDPTPTASPLAN